MKGIEEIYYHNSCIAIIFRHNLSVEGVQFFTDAKNPFQIGLHHRTKGTKLTPHIHRLDYPLIITSIQEILFVLAGKILVTLYTKDGEIINKKTLKAGDSVLLMDQAHGINFLTDARIFEVKQGPFPGIATAKTFVTAKS